MTSGIGATECGLNFLDYCIEHVGGVMLLVMLSLSDSLRMDRAQRR